MSVIRLREPRLDCGSTKSATPWLRLSEVGPGGTPTMRPVQSARFQVSAPPPAEGGAAPATAQFRLYGTLDELGDAVALGDAVTGPGVSELIDTRGFAAVRVEVVAAEAGAVANVTILASSARTDEPETP